MAADEHKLDTIVRRKSMSLNDLVHGDLLNRRELVIDN